MKDVFLEEGEEEEEEEDNIPEDADDHINSYMERPKSEFKTIKQSPSFPML